MASLSNINGLFDVHSTGAILFSTSHGTSGQILKSNGNAAPTWIPQSDIVGAYLPLAGGTLTGATSTASGISFTVGGALTGTTASFNAGATNVVATFTSTDGIAGIALVDSSGNVELSASGNTFQVQPAGGVAALTVSSTNATFAGDARFNSRVRIGDVTGLSNRGTVRIDTRGDVPADLLFGRDTAGTATSWDNVYWSLSSRGSSEGNNFKLYRGSAHDSPYNSEAVPFQISPDLNATFAGNVTINGTLTIGGNSAITRSGSTAQGRLAIWQNDTAIKGNNNLTYASQYLTVGVGTTGGFAAIRINAATIATSYLDFTEGASFTKRAQIEVDTNDNMYFRNTSSNTLRMTLLSGGNFGIGTGSPNALLNLSQAAGANIRFDNETTTNYFTIGEGVGTNNVFSFRGNSYRSTDTMSIDFVNDRVGIGTISPNEKLQVAGKTIINTTGNYTSNAGSLSVNNAANINGGVVDTHNNGDGRYYTRVAQGYTGSGSAGYWHIKTNILTSQYIMFLAKFYGYIYGQAGILDLQHTGYAYGGTSVINQATTNNGTNASASSAVYLTAAKEVCFRIDMSGSTYYAGVWMDIGFQNPTGGTHNLLIQATAWSATANYYT